MGFMKNMLNKLKGGVQETEPIKQPEATEPTFIKDSPKPPSGPCTICGSAPKAVLIKYHGASVWACNKKAHQARPKDRQELKKFKKLQKKMEQRAKV
jgi:hypothetical protein